MYLLIDTVEGRTRVGTATAEQALRHHTRLVDLGLAPSVTDLSGNEVDVSDLRGRTEEARAGGDLEDRRGA